MASTLVFPDGVRLVEWDEIPGTKPAREEVLKRTQQANVAQGFVLKSSDDERFQFFAEINVDAPKVWTVFKGLCEALIRSEGTLLFSGDDLDPQPMGCADISAIISVLSHYQYQLANDGFLQFGVVGEKNRLINEVFVEPAKNFKVWLNDEAPSSQS